MNKLSRVRKSRPRHRKRFALVSSIATFVSFALVGWVTVANVQNMYELNYHSNTADIIRARQKTIRQLQTDIKTQAQKIDTLQSVLGADSATTSSSDASSARLAALEGPGITVTLSDSKKWDQVADQEGANPNDYVVHQQDIEAVVNALWAGGAEAITIQGERLLPTSAIKCVGNVLLLNGQQFSPPYEISAIGPQNDMKDVINASKPIKIYKQYVEADGLGWQLETNNLLHFKAVSISPQPMEFAQVEENQGNNEQNEQ